MKKSNTKYTCTEDLEIHDSLQSADALLVGAGGWTLVLKIDVKAIRNGNFENMACEPEVLTREDGWIAKRFREIAYENHIPVFKSPLTNLQDLSDYVVYEAISETRFKEIVALVSNSEFNEYVMWDVEPGQTVLEWMEENESGLFMLSLETLWGWIDTDRIERDRLNYIRERIKTEHAKMNDPTNEAETEYKELFEKKANMVVSRIEQILDGPYEPMDTKLRKASVNGDIETMAEFFDSGVGLKARDDYGLTPLLYTIFGQKSEAVQFLIARGANLNTRAINGETSLHVATQIAANATNKKALLEIMVSLLQAGANPAIKDHDNKTPLDHAMDNNDTEVIELLRKYN